MRDSLLLLDKDLCELDEAEISSDMEIEANEAGENSNSDDDDHSLLLSHTRGKQPTARRERTPKPRTIVLNVMCMYAMAGVLRNTILLLYYYIHVYKIFFRKCRFVSLPGGQILNVNVLDHWPMPRDASSCYVSVGVGVACACRI